MRCLEILMTVNYDPARIDPLFAALYRSFTLLRRVLLKGEDRYHMFCRNMLLASVERKNITGPVHGFINTCDHLHIKISKLGDDLFIESPYGTGILINSMDRTLFNSIIRDSINYTILNQLHQRTSSDTDPNYRKDMPGVDPYTDIRATSLNHWTPMAPTSLTTKGTGSRLTLATLS